MRLLFPRHELHRAFPGALGTLAPQESPVIQEKPQQLQIIPTQLASQEKVVAQPRVQVLGSDMQVVMACNSYGKGLTAFFPCYN